MGNHYDYYPKKTPTMKDNTRNAVTSDYPADTRRPEIPGSLGVKYATDDCPGAHTLLPAAVTISKDRPSIRPKHRIGTWNVRGLLKPGKLTIVENEMHEHNLFILGLCETHMKGAGHCRTTSGNTMYFSGHETESRNGVAVIVPSNLASFISGYMPVSDRIITIRLNCKPLPLNIVQVYAPTAQSSQEDLDTFYESLNSVVDKISRREMLLVQGDWNSKVGNTQNDNHLRHILGKYGLGIRNERGEKFIDFCVGNNLVVTNTCFQHHKRRLYTWISPGDRYRNQIDYIAIPHRWKSSVTNARTYPGADCGSDHQLLVVDLQMRFKCIRKKIKPTERLAPPQIEHFRSQVEVKLQQTTAPESQELPQTLWKDFQNLITEVLDSMAKAPNTKKDWISDDTWKRILERKELKCARYSNKHQQEYSRLNKLVQNLCRRDKNHFLEQICVEIEKHADKYQTADLFKKIRQITRNFKPLSWIIDDREGNPIHDIDKAAERWKEYCAELYKDVPLDPPFPKPAPLELEPDILISEVEYVVRKLKRNKAPGSDRITAEALKALGERGIQSLHRICNSVWRTCEWPLDWVHSAILPLHKKGSVRNCGNYRTIALISHASKVLLHIINNRLRSFLDWQIPQEQAGFVKGKGTREQILNLRQMVEKCYEFNTPVIMCFIDYQKAFDCVRWQQLWSVLEEAGVPEHIVILVRNLYEVGYGTIKLGNTTSSSFKFQKGVRQGCIISPILFNIYGEYIMRRTLDGWDGGIKIGGMKISNLRYADDTTLFASSEEEMSCLLTRLECVSEEMGLAINTKKTKLMIVDRFASTQCTSLLKDYELVEQFLYLGSLITNKGNCEPEIRRRIGMAKTAMTQMSKIWKDSNISRRTKIHIVRTLVFSIFLYGSEAWTLKATDRQRIDAFEMWCWRRLLRIPWTARRTNVSILKQLKIEQQNRLSSICLHRVLKYFGHIARRNTDNLERLIVTGKIEGKRPRGRSPKRWSDQVSQHLEMPVNKALHEAEDRRRWREAIRTLHGGSHDPQQ